LWFISTQLALGKFSRVSPAGLVCLNYPCEAVVAYVGLKLRYMEVHCDTKTKDNVFVKVVVAGNVQRFFCDRYFFRAQLIWYFSSAAYYLSFHFYFSFDLFVWSYVCVNPQYNTE
jgi:hypothetical protein